MGTRGLMVSLLLLLVFAAVLPFLLPLKDGKPLFSLSEITPPSLPQFQPLLGEEENDEQVTLYRWKDQEGSVVFSNEPPPANIPYEVVKTGPAPSIPATPAGAAASEPVSSIVTPNPALDVTKQAEEVDELLAERKAQQDRVLNAVK